MYCTSHFILMIEPLVICGTLHDCFNLNSLYLFSIFIHFISCSTCSGTCNLPGNFRLFRSFAFEMNCQRFDRVVFWEHFSYDRKQELSLNFLSEEDDTMDHEALFGADCFDYFTNTEAECITSMKRGDLFNFDTDLGNPELCHFWFFVTLPLTRMISFLTTKRLRELLTFLSLENGCH